MRTWVRAQDDKHNSTLHNLYSEAQKNAASKLELFTLVQGMSNLISCPMIGPISNRFGRKPACLLVIISGLLCTLAVAVISEFEYLLVAIAFFGLGGGWYANHKQTRCSPFFKMAPKKSGFEMCFAPSTVM